MSKSDLEELLALHIRLAGLPQPEREYLFASEEYGRLWRLDFAYPAIKLGIAVQGGVWSRGRHTRGSGYTADCEKYSHAAMLGWRVIFVTADHIDNGQAIAWVKEALAKAAESPAESATERGR